MRSSKAVNTVVVWSMLLCFWLVILFSDRLFSPSSSSPEISSMSGAVFMLSDTGVLSNSWQLDAMISGIIHQNLDTAQNFQDLHLLEYLYTKNKNSELLQPLIEKFLLYYQFDKANTYLDLLVAQQSGYLGLELDPYKVIYTRLHHLDLGLNSQDALSEVMSLVQYYREHNQITSHDVLFYQWLQSLWWYDYSGALAAFGQITDTRYHSFLSSYQSALANFVKIKNPPLYYRDGLIALTLLKNGYFTFAKRLALHALSQNQNYILPYQVLAYTNFLTQNREAAKEYFLKLADFDVSNISLYKFLIGVSYYWYGDHQQSLLYLTQVSDAALQLDVYRYMLLSYIHDEDSANMIRMRQNLLGQSDLQSSDFSLFFEHMFYYPFRSGSPFTLYQEVPQLADLYLKKCTSLFTGSQADVCLYGEVGLQLSRQNLSWIGQQIVLLAQNYHQSYIYHILGDYYMQTKSLTQAKEAYLKALSIADTSNEQTILTTKIQSLSRR